MEPIEKLRKELTKFDYTHSGMCPITSNTNELAFFPYGNGLWQEKNITAKFPLNKIMILGQDFGTIEYVKRLNGNGESTQLPTWRNLINLLDTAEISKSDCFFTNAIIGVRQKGEEMTGAAPPFKTKKYINGEKFLDQCWDYFNIQVDIQKPSLIICMGKNVYHFLSKYLDIQHFSVKDKYRDIANDIFCLNNVVINNHTTNLTLIVHPSTPNRKNNRSITEEAAMIKYRYL